MFAPSPSSSPFIGDPSHRQPCTSVGSTADHQACLGWSAAGSWHVAADDVPAAAGSPCPPFGAALRIHGGTDSLHLLASAMDDVLWIYEPHSARFFYVSPAYEGEWMGNAQALYADAQQWLRTVHPDDESLLRASFAGLARGQGYELEYRRTPYAGAQRWIAERVLPVTGHAGPWPRFAGVSHDISRRKHEHMELLRSSQAQKEFMAILSHELRNPLQAIRSATALLSLCGAQRMAVERNAMAVIERQVGQVARLVDDLLDVSRIEAGKLCLHPRATRIDEVLESAVADHRILIDAKLLRLHYTGVPGPVWVHGDSARLTQVFGNLLHNAAKFSFAGGVIEIGILPAESRGEVAISIRDEGAGIDPELVDSVFELYVQQAGRSSRDDGGLGIGLSVVRGLVQLHGGTVSVRSDGLGRGSEFVVTLPAAHCLPDKDGTCDHA